MEIKSVRNVRLWIWGVGAVVIAVILVANYVVRERMTPTDAMAMALREQALALKPGDINMVLPAEPLAVYGVVIDMTLTDGTATLVALASGDASIYFDAGGGMLSGGSNSTVATAAKGLVALAQADLGQFQPAKTGIPPRGDARITVLTTQGPRTVTAREQALGDGSHKLSNIYYKANEVVTALRESGGGGG
jgi:hypothetical protein